MTNMVIYANCQGNGIRKCINYLTKDSSSINIECIENWRLLSGELDINDFMPLVEGADIFIYQPIQSGHGFFSTTPDQENIASNLPVHCQKLSFSYIVNDGLWPCFIDGDTIVNADIIDKHISDGAEIAEILKLYDQGELNFNLLNRMRASLDIHQQREEETDIKINHFLRNEISRRPLFLTQNHPTTACFLEVISQIIDHGIMSNIPNFRESLSELSDNFADLPGYYPISRYSISELGLNYGDTADQNEVSYKNLLIKHYEEVKSKQV